MSEKEDEEVVELDEETVKKIAEKISEGEVSLGDDEDVEYHLNLSTETRIIKIDERLDRDVLEFISGYTNYIEVTVENTGEKDYPGGEISDVTYDLGYSGGVGDPTTYEIPEIESGETKSITMSISPSFEGSGGLMADIESKGGGDVVINGENKNELNIPFRTIPLERQIMVQDVRRIREILEEEYVD